MPSTLVHVAVGGLVGVAVLGDRVTPRTAALVLAAAAVPDLDTFAGLLVQGAHRSLLHTLLLPASLAGGLAYDTRLRGRSRLVDRWGPGSIRAAWAAVAALCFGGIFPDLFTNGVNAFYPLVDTFYSVDGKLLLSNKRGVVQTFVDLSSGSSGAKQGTTETVHYSTGVDPSPGKESGNVERVFPVVRAGWQLMLVVTSATVLAARLWVDGERPNRQRQGQGG